MGYLYHIRKCGKEASELEKLALKCHHCEKPYRSKAGLAYHMRSEHGPVSIASSVAIEDVCYACHSYLCLLCISNAAHKEVFNWAHGFSRLSSSWQGI